MKGHESNVWSVQYSPGGKLLVSASHDRTVRLWDVQRRRLHKTLEGHTEGVVCAAFSPDGQSVASGSYHPDSSVRVWNVQTGEQTAVFEGHSIHVYEVAFSPDGQTLASGSYDGTALLWTVPNEEEASD